MTRKKLLVFAVTAIVSLLLAAYISDKLRPPLQRMLNVAASRGDTKMMRFLLFAGAEANGFTESVYYCLTDNYRSIEITYPLHEAAWQGHNKAVELLLDNGADVNAVNESNTTALWYAALGGHADTARLLLSRGADVDFRLPDGTLCESALEIAGEGGETEVVKVLLEHGAGKRDNAGPALWEAIWFDHIETAKLLIENGADVNYVDERNGYSVLQSAEEEGHTELIYLLKRAGAKK